MAHTESPDPRPVRIVSAGGLRGYFVSVGAFDRNVKLFLTVTAFRGMVIAVISTVLNLYLYSLGYDARFIGLINGANSIAVLLVSLPLGYLADRLGRRPVLVAGGITYPLTILGLSLVTSAPGLLLFNFLFGLTAAAYWVAGIPLLVASTTQGQRVQAFSINSLLLWGLGPLGAFLGGQVVELGARVLSVPAASTTALRWGMFFMVILAALGGLPTFFLREPARASVHAAEAPPLGHIARLFAQLLTPDVFLAFGLGSILTFSQLYFHLRFHLDPGEVGIILAAAGIVAGIGTLCTPIFARRWGNLRTAVRFQWTAVVFLVGMALATRLPLAVVAFTLALTLRGMLDPVYTAFVQERVPELYRARMTAFYSVTYSIGFSLGPAVSGQIQKEGGFTPAFLVGTAFYFIGASLLWLFFGRRSRGTAVPAGDLHADETLKTM